jgi:hypothetical protein
VAITAYSSHALLTPCVLARIPDESHWDVSAFMYQIFCYIFIVHNFINKILRKLKKESCTVNPHPDNREYTVVLTIWPEMARNS